jgi:hypothetical protein
VESEVQASKIRGREARPKAVVRRNDRREGDTAEDIVATRSDTTGKGAH